MKAWPNRAALLRRVGSRRITDAADFEDSWSYGLSYVLKPRRLLGAAGLAVTVMLVIATGLWSAGFQIIGPGRAQLLGFAESAVPHPAALSAADLRVRIAGLARAVEFVDRAVTPIPPDHAGSSWYARLFGRHSPEIDPGRTAVLLNLIDRINNAPLIEREGLVERIVLRAGGETESWSVLKVVADLPPEARKLLLTADAAQFKEVAAWLKQLPLREFEPSSLLSAIKQQQEELADVIQAGRTRVKAMTEELERRKSRNSVCRRHIDDFERCLKTVPGSR